MKRNSLGLIALIILFVSTNAFAQPHGLQVDDGAQHYSTIMGPNPGGAYTLPAGGGALVTSASPGSIPLRGIIMWSGSIGSIPSGWALCDGAIHSGQPTPDLRNAFIVGAGNTYAVGQTGGSTNPVYSASGIIGTSTNVTGIGINGSFTGESLNQSTNAAIIGGTFSLTGGLCSCGYSYTQQNNQLNGGTFINDPGHSHSITDLGHSHTFNASGISISTPSNLPPFYALAYIMRVQ